MNDLKNRGTKRKFSEFQWNDLYLKKMKTVVGLITSFDKYYSNDAGQQQILLWLEHLLSPKGPINANDRFGGCPLICIAAYKGRTRVVRYLVEFYKADIRQTVVASTDSGIVISISPELRKLIGATPLYLAAKAGHLSTCQYLLGCTPETDPFGGQKMVSDSCRFVIISLSNFFFFSYFLNNFSIFAHQIT
jgi:hypothetical protein